MGLLSGLGKLGLGGLDSMKLYEDPDLEAEAESAAQEEAEPEVPKVREEDFLLKKSCKCPACDRDFKTLAVRAGKAKLIGTDRDLRPQYDGIEPLKYDVTMCPYCGCASLSRNWGSLTDNQRRTIKKEIAQNFRPVEADKDTYTYDEAVNRYQMALANAIVKQAKNSEKAYICLKAGWLLRSKWMSLDHSDPNYNVEVAETMSLEREFLENALEGLVNARATENPPICGMDDMTVDYLIAALSVRFEKYDQAARLVAKLLGSKAINSRMKEKALDLKDEILKARSKPGQPQLNELPVGQAE
ncbi:MAG: DUF2225 domain-containing protein [Lachnospiraceae bacterium]|nr:DUF2225 domain-containing protein [Lachnospiraceae bacterium]